MLVAKTREFSADKLRSNFGAGVSLTLVVMLSYLCVNLIGKIAAMFFSTVMLDFHLTSAFSVDSVVGAVVTLILALSLISPLRLNVKSWYQFIKGEQLPVTVAFSYFASLKKYLAVLHFCIIRFTAVFLTFLVPMLPSILLAGILQQTMLVKNATIGSSFGAVFIMMVALFMIGLFVSIYFAVGFFFVDYIYIKGLQKNPYKALMLSRRIAKKNRTGLLVTLLKSLPYYLLCLCLVTIPFVVPKIRANFAVYTDEILG